MNIIFDFDGTLFDMSSIVGQAFNDALEIIGDTRKSEEFVISCVGAPIKEIAKRLLDDKSKIDDFLEWSLKCEIQQIDKTARMFDGAVDMLKELKKEGHKLSICSNGRELYLAPIIKKFDLVDYFEIIWHKHYGYSKNRAAKIVNSRMGKVDKTIFVGDREEDIEAGNVNGFVSVGCAYGFGHIDELTEADYIANNTQELLEMILSV